MQKIFPQGKHSKLLLSDLYVFLGFQRVSPLSHRRTWSNMAGAPQHSKNICMQPVNHLLGMFVWQSDRYHLPRPRNSQCYKTREHQVKQKPKIHLRTGCQSTFCVQHVHSSRNRSDCKLRSSNSKK